MSEDLDELYQEVLLDHSKKPRNFGVLSNASGSATGKNPLCGDHVTVHVEIEGDSVADIRFEGAGCAISQASASVMTELVKGLSKDEARKFAERFQLMVTNDQAAEFDCSEEPLVCAFAGVRKFPVRVKCATLAWHALCSAIENCSEQKKIDLKRLDVANNDIVEKIGNGS